MPVYQENENKWTKDGRKWYFKVYYTDMYGKRKRKRSKLYLMKRDAIEAESEFLTKIKTVDETDNNIKFDTVYNEWLEFKKSKVKVSTYYKIVKTLNKHILDFFKSFKLHNIKLNSINQWRIKLVNQGLDIDYTNIIINYLKEILNFAKTNYNFDYKIIDKIYTIRDDTPKSEKTDAELNFWTYSEFKKFINKVDDKFYYLIFNFLYFTGLRIGEFSALTWKDIDLRNKTVSITKSLTCKVIDKKYMITSPKTSNSIRVIDLDDNLIKLLKEHKNNEKNILGFNENMFVFGNVKYISQTTLRRHIANYAKLAKVKYISIHGFRHSHVSLLIYLGCDVRDVANRIGDTVQIVESTYYHMFPKKKENAIKLLNNLEK